MDTEQSYERVKWTAIGQEVIHHEIVLSWYLLPR